MTITVDNPYTGEAAETCSVSFAAQQSMAETGVSGQQTEAQYSKSQLLGEWGVIKGKAASGWIPAGTKLFRATTPSGMSHVVTWDGESYGWRTYGSGGNLTNEVKGKTASQIHSAFFSNNALELGWKYTIVGESKKAPTLVDIPVDITDASWKTDSATFAHLPNGHVLAYATGHDGKALRIAKSGDAWMMQRSTDGTHWDNWYFIDDLDDPDFSTNGKEYEDVPLSDKWLSKPPITEEAKPAAAAPTPSPAVSPGSTSAGSMTDEDVATLFVTTKDKLATEKGLNIKGSNPALDQEVYAAIGNATGYTPAEAKAKVDSYKATGKKLSALKKKTLKSGSKVPDPKPNDVPTVATAQVAQEVVNQVEQVVEAKPDQHYSDADVAAQYIIAKDAIVAASNGKWTLYTKSDELDLEIAIKVGLKTGLNPTQQKQAVANYLSTGKKLSQLKKSLIKDGKLTPQADTLKKTKAQQSAEAIVEDIAKKADEGFLGDTPQSVPTVADVTAASAEQDNLGAGHINHVSEAHQSQFYALFKGQSTGKYLTDSPESVYQSILITIDKATSAHAGTPLANLTPLQALRIVDAHGAVKFNVTNDKLFEKKVVEWLTTPEGKSKVSEIAAKAAAAKKAEEAAQKLMDSQPPLPDDSALFEVISTSKAIRLQEAWLAKKPFEAGEKNGLRTYTGGNYRAMNMWLRGLSDNISSGDKMAIENSRKGMRPSTEHVLLHRGTGLDQFGLQSHEEHLIWGLTGKLEEDKGFLSTSVGGRPAFSGKVMMEVECPAGTPMMYVDNFSQHPGENEMLLQKGLRYRVLRVEKKQSPYGGVQYVVRLRVEN